MLLDRQATLVEVIATKILQSSSQSGWPLRNIHISNDNGSFTFYVDVFFPLSLPRLLPDLTVYMAVSYKKQAAYHSRAHGFTPVFGGVRDAHHYSFLCYVICFVCLRPVLCTQCCLFFWIVHFWFLFQFSLTFIPMGSICSALLVNLFLYSNETDFMKEHVKSFQFIIQRFIKK